MDDETFIATLRGACSEAITEYRAQFPDGIPLTEFEDRDVGPFASAGDVDARFTDFTEFYDGLFDVDSTPYRDEWREKLVYDCTRRERLEQLTNDLPRSLTFLLIEGRYVRSTGHIGLTSSTRLKARESSRSGSGSSATPDASDFLLPVDTPVRARFFGTFVRAW